MAAKLELKELGDFLMPILVIPIGGKEYHFKGISAKDALGLQAGTTAAAKEVADGVPFEEVALAADTDESISYIKTVLGESYDEVMTDGLPMVAVQHIIAMVTAWAMDPDNGFKTAQEYYRSGGKVRAGRKAPTDRQPRTATQTHTGAESTKTESATTTSTPKATAKAGPGKTSSTTGTP